MKWNSKIRAGALQFVLFIGVVIALLLLTFVTLAHTHNRFGKKTLLLIDAIKKTELGLQYTLRQPLRLNDSIDLELGLEDAIELQSQSSYWGIFEKHSVTAKSFKNRFTKTVLTGRRASEERPALYLQDKQRPMIIVGRAAIIGDAFLPKQGIRPGNISGNSFYGNSLIDGRQRESTAQLPDLDSGCLAYLNALLQPGAMKGNYEMISLSRGMIAANSFNRPTQLLQGDVIDLSGASLVGNIIVQASRRILVDATSNLQDVILVAPEIQIKDGVSGIFQAIANKRIQVGKRCDMAYPSALVVLNKATERDSRPANQQPELEIGKGTSVRGAVLYRERSEDRTVFYPQVRIEEDAIVYGEVYCERNLEHRGTVIGTVMTSGFVAMENGSIYQNHLFNGRIESALPDSYAGLPIIGTAYDKTICKWLY